MVSFLIYDSMTSVVALHFSYCLSNSSLNPSRHFAGILVGGVGVDHHLAGLDAPQRQVAQARDLGVQAVGGQRLLDAGPPRLRQAGVVGPPQRPGRADQRAEADEGQRHAQSVDDADVFHACSYDAVSLSAFNSALCPCMIRAMRFAVLGSGSGGNAAVIEAGGVRLLVDAGLSARQIVRRLKLMGIAPESLDGILLTHEHGDHVRGLRVLMKSMAVPVYATPMTREVVREQVDGAAWKIFESGAAFALGGLAIRSFAVPHDAVEPVGFVFRCEERSVGLVSDSGHVTSRVIEALRGVDSLFVEANYDDALLEADSRRPWSTKQRIASRHGHLSNAQTAELVAELAAAGGLRRVVLGHLSRDCNAPEVALAAVKSLVPEVACACQDEPCGWHEGPATPCDIAFRADELFG